MNLTRSNNWKMVKLGEVAEVVGGGTPSTKEPLFWEGDIPWITPKDLSNYQSIYIERGERHISEEGMKNSSVRLLPKNSILFSSRAPIGYVAINRVPVTTNQGFKSLIPKEGTDYKFLYYWLLHNGGNIEKQASGSVFAEVSGSVMKNLEISLPESIDEQKEIAGVLGCLDDKIELLRKENKTLEELAQTLFKRWFVDFEFPNAIGKMVDSELGKIPEGWRVGKLGELFKITMGQSPNGESYNKNKEGMIFYQGRTDFGERFPSVRLYTTEPKRTAETFDVLVSVRAPVGDLNQATEKCCLGRGVAGVSSDLKSFCFYTMKSIQSEIQKFEAGGTVFGSINKADFENMKVVIPTQDVQENFDLLAQSMDKKIFNNFSEIQTLSKLRDGLLDKIFTN